jgi:hypothetical protein
MREGRCSSYGRDASSLSVERIAYFLSWEITEPSVRDAQNLWQVVLFTQRSRPQTVRKPSYGVISKITP